MGPDLRVAALPIARLRCRERVVEALVAGHPRRYSSVKAPVEQPLAESRSTSGASRARYRCRLSSTIGASLRERRRPRSELRGLRACFSDRVPLAQHATVALPGVEVARFHVEHSPVEKAPPLAGPALDELVHARVDRVHRQQRGQLRHPRGRLAVDLLLEPPCPIRDAEPSRGRLRRRPPRTPRSPRCRAGRVGASGECGTSARGRARRSPRAGWSCRRRSARRCSFARELSCELDLAQTPKGRDADAAQRQDGASERR